VKEETIFFSLFFFGGGGGGGFFFFGGFGFVFFFSFLIFYAYLFYFYFYVDLYPHLKNAIDFNKIKGSQNVCKFYKQAVQKLTTTVQNAFLVIILNLFVLYFDL
jgi:hypothetical protein